MAYLLCEAPDVSKWNEIAVRSDDIRSILFIDNDMCVLVFGEIYKVKRDKRNDWMLATYHFKSYAKWALPLPSEEENKGIFGASGSGRFDLP